MNVHMGEKVIETSFVRRSLASIADKVDDLEKSMDPKGASNRATALNLVKSLTGSTVLVIATAALNGSWVVSTTLLGFYAIIFLFTFWLIAECCDQTKEKTYRDLWRVSVGAQTGYVVDIAICFHAWCSCIAYVICIRDYLGIVLSALGQDLSPQVFLWPILGCVVFPLCLFRNLSGLKYASMIGALFTFYAFIYFYVLFFRQTLPVHAFQTPAENLKDTATTFTAVGLFSGCLGHLSAAFGSAHINACRFYGEMKKKTISNFLRVAAFCWIFVFAFKAPFGIIGLGIFGKKTQGNIMKNFDTRIGAYSGFNEQDKTDLAAVCSSPLVLIMVIAMAISLAFSFPLMFNAGRDSFNGVCKRFNAPWSGERVSRIVITTCLWGMLCVLGAFIKELGPISEIKGSYCAVALCLVLPAIIYLKLGSQKEELAAKVQRKPIVVKLCYFIILFGIFQMSCGTFAIIRKLVA